MTGTEKTSLHFARGFKPERLGGSLLFRAPYLESRWVRAAFRTLLFCAAAVVLLAALTGRFAGWQAEYKAQALLDARTAWSEWAAAYQAAAEAGDLTGCSAALDRQLDAVSHALFFFPEDSTLREAQDVAEQERAVLSAEIAAAYQAAEGKYLAGDPLGALAGFLTVRGYRDTDGWVRLITGCLSRTARRAAARGDILTAWAGRVRLMSLTAPDKLPPLLAGYAGLRGVWVCRQDFRAAALPSENGDGRAGGGAIRCLKAEGDVIYGGIGYGAPLRVDAVPFTAVLASGGVAGISGGESFSGPEGLVLAFPAGGILSGVEIVAENILRVTEGGWEGTYYRVLG